MTIRQKAIKGVKWTTISTLVIAFSALLKISILTRFLDASDFGLMALITFVLGFMDLFMDMGLTSAILHIQNIKKEQYASLFWLNVGFSVILFAILQVIAPLISDIYSAPELQQLISIASGIIILSAIGRQYKTIFQKKLEFKTIAIIDISACLIALIFAIFLAFLSFGVYALVYAALIQYGISNLTYFVIGNKQQKILFHFKLYEVKPFLKIGYYQVASQVVNYFNRDLDILIIGKYFGSDVLGGYSLAKQLVSKPILLVNPMLTIVAAPVLSKYQKDIDALKTQYLRLVNIIISINFPIYMVLFIFAPIIVEILYGNSYAQIIILVRILSIYMIIRSTGNPLGSLAIATGRTDMEFKWNIIALFVTPVFLFVGIQFTIEMVAFSIVVSQIILFYPYWKFIIKKLLVVDFIEYLKAIFSLESYTFICKKLTRKK